MTRTPLLIPALAIGLCTAGPARAELIRPTLNFNGTTGLIDMPSGEMMPDGHVGITYGAFGPFARRTLTFQIAPWLQGSFRYTGEKGLGLAGVGPAGTYYDRAFDIRLRLLSETEWLPSVTVGLQDFVGTGVYASEYVAATKTFGDRGQVRVTAGVGWGRMGSRAALGSPFGDRPPVADTLAGALNYRQWFRGPASPFGGVEWQVTDRLGLKLEYSSDDYLLAARDPNRYRARSPFNFGAEYQVNNVLRVGAYSMNGRSIGVLAQLTLDPRNRPAGAFIHTAPLPLQVRPDRRTNPDAWSPEWTAQADAPSILRRNLQRYLATDGITLESISLSADVAQLRFRAPRLDSSGQAIGRVARAMAATLPASIEVFQIVPVVRGMAVSQVTLRRSDLERLEFAPGNDAALRARAMIGPAGAEPANALRGDGLYPRFSWALVPYTRFRFFDLDQQLKGDVGLRLAARYDIAPGLVLSGSVTQRLAGNLKKADTMSTSVLPRVRSDINLYDREGGPLLERLQLAWYTKLTPDLYGRVTAGYLERMFGGVSAEILWKPVDSRLALGAEVNYVKQRDTDQRLGFRQYDYSVVTGHVSAYYAFGDGYHAQLDVGRYLAGDVGATLSIDRQFSNGWRIGAFATKTNVSAQRFGAGGFDKGIRLDIPLNWAVGRGIDTRYSTTIRPFTRDGGARLEVEGRLYESVRDYHSERIDANWGRFWR
ncbi:MAG: YjbH domain-containing protein [Gemmobacter sp.]